MLDDQLNKEELKSFHTFLGTISAIILMAISIGIASLFKSMQGYNILMFTYGVGLLTRPLSVRMTRLIQRK